MSSWLPLVAFFLLFVGLVDGIKIHRLIQQHKQGLLTPFTNNNNDHLLLRDPSESSPPHILVEAGISYPPGFQHAIAWCEANGCGFGIWAAIYDDLASDAGVTSPWFPPHTRTLSALAKDKRALAASIYTGPDKGNYLKSLSTPTKSEVENRLIAIKAHFTSPPLMVKHPGIQKADGGSDGTERFWYEYDGQGRLNRVRGHVIQGPGTDAKDRDMSATLFEYVFNIVAASLGGSNNRIINFFPQIGWSNRGAYFAAETLAANLRDYYNDLERQRTLVSTVQVECVEILIVFNYPTMPPNPKEQLIPNGGQYQVSWNLNCVDPTKPIYDVNMCSYLVRWTNDIKNVIGPTDRDKSTAELDGMMKQAPRVYQTYQVSAKRLAPRLSTPRLHCARSTMAGTADTTTMDLLYADLYMYSNDLLHTSLLVDLSSLLIHKTSITRLFNTVFNMM